MCMNFSTDNVHMCTMSEGFFCILCSSLPKVQFSVVDMLCYPSTCASADDANKGEFSIRLQCSLS
jgi:hypothetical protein